MKLISVNVGLPREVVWQGKTITTGIFKSPVVGPVSIRGDNLDGDRQADLSVHGGPTKAIYVYLTQHYRHWADELQKPDLPWGSFGENFTIEGLDEDSVNIGDELKVGTSRLVVTEPRMPCYKLNARFGRPDMVKLFLRAQRSGFYFGVIEEGQVQAGDEPQLLNRHPEGLTVSEVARLYTTEKENSSLLRKAISVEALPESWRGYFKRQLEKLR